MNQKDQRKEHAEHKTSLTKEAIFISTVIREKPSKNMEQTDIYIYIYIYIYICVCVYIYMCVYIYISVDM